MIQHCVPWLLATPPTWNAKRAGDPAQAARAIGSEVSECA